MKVKKIRMVIVGMMQAFFNDLFTGALPFQTIFYFVLHIRVSGCELFGDDGLAGPF
jgi:hypothetical protein